MDKRKKRIIDIIQWILIIFLLFVCGYIYFNDKAIDTRKNEMKNDNTYIKIYDSQKIKDLERINKELYDSVKALKNVESAVQIEYQYIYKTDTIKVDNFEIKDDSIYHYHSDNDTVMTDIEIKASNLKWCTISNRINNKFTVITQKEDNKVKTKINFGDNINIRQIDTWRKKKTFKDNFFYGPSVGAGYGVINKKFDLYVGFSVGYRF